MSKAIKVRRSGFHRIFKKKPFREWLDDQVISDLTYDPGLKSNHEKGWTNDMFMRECWNRKLDVHSGTALRWASGAQPRPFILKVLKQHFPTIKF